MRYDVGKIMYCIKCGANNSDEAVYCQKCGNLLESEEETRVVQKMTPSKFSVEDDDEKQIFSIRPTLMFVKIGYVAAIVGAFLLVALFARVQFASAKSDFGSYRCFAGTFAAFDSGVFSFEEQNDQIHSDRFKDRN